VLDHFPILANILAYHYCFTSYALGGKKEKSFHLLKNLVKKCPNLDWVMWPRYGKIPPTYIIIF
jgi:hypothetical protein